MTDRELEDAVRRRADACRRISGRTSNRTLGEMSPGNRAEVERIARTFWDLDAAIVAELRRRNAPVVIGGRELHLTHDRLNFVAVVAGTTTSPLGHDKSSTCGGDVGGMLHDYGRAR